ncbi:MAG: ATP-binding protein [archaeon]
MDINLLKQVIVEQKTYFEQDGDFVNRDALSQVKKFIDLPQALIISGIRRCGKSILLKQIKNAYFKDKTTYYFNFEEERIFGFTVKDFDMLYEAFIELYGESKVFFFDELQNIQGWELFVRRMYDRGFKFLITGSNSSMLSKELGSRLTGRYIPIELYPFSFKEFLLLSKFNIKSTVQTTQERAVLRKHFNEYLLNGGFPEYLLFNAPESLKTLYNNIIYRDTLVRYGISDEKSMRELCLFLFSNFSKEYSFNSLKKMLNLGSPNTVKSYIGHLESSYLVFSTSKYSGSLKEQLYSNKKAYVIDSGLAKLMSFRLSIDIGRILENIAFIELKRRGHNIFYFREKNECDFIISKGNKNFDAIQVCASMQNNDTKEREFKGLIEAAKALKLNSGLILTENEEFKEKIEGIYISALPLWKWLIAQ